MKYIWSVTVFAAVNKDKQLLKSLPDDVTKGTLPRSCFVFVHSAAKTVLGGWNWAVNWGLNVNFPRRTSWIINHVCHFHWNIDWKKWVKLDKHFDDKQTTSIVAPFSGKCPNKSSDSDIPPASSLHRVLSHKQALNSSDLSPSCHGDDLSRWWVTSSWVARLCICLSVSQPCDDVAASLCSKLLQ